MITIFGTTYFTIGAGFVVLALAAPFLFWFARWLWRPNVEDKPRHVRWLTVGGTTFGLLLLLAVGLFWDVYLIGQRAKELCQETGLVVYRRVEPAGIVGLTNIESYQALKIPFVENEIQGKRYRYSLNNGRHERLEVDEFQSSYQLERLSERQPAGSRSIDKYFVHHSELIHSRATGETIGKLKVTSIDAGWLDRSVFSVTGFAYKPWICGRSPQNQVVVGNERMTHRDLINAVIDHPINPGTEHNGHQQLLPERVVR